MDWSNESYSGQYHDGSSMPSSCPPSDPVLLACLEPGGERLTLLKLEDALVRFMSQPRQDTLRMDGLPSYHRLLAHRLADRMQLDRRQEVAEDGNRMITSLLFVKTPYSTCPRPLYMDVAQTQTEKASAARPTMHLKLKPRLKSRPSTSTSSSTSSISAAATLREGAERNPNSRNTEATAPASSSSMHSHPVARRENKTVEDREKAYAVARARIFGTEENLKSTATPPSQSGLAKGPDGSIGFTDRVGGSTANMHHESKFNMAAPKPNTPGQQTNCSNANITRATWRNREAEMQDPEFTRHHPQLDVRYPSSGGFAATATTIRSTYNDSPNIAMMRRPPLPYAVTPPVYVDVTHPPPPPPSTKQSTTYQVEFPPLG